MEFSVAQGEFAAQPADALVYAAETTLGMESQVATTLRDEAGSYLAEDASAHAPVGLGDAVVTDGYDLDAEYVIHAAAIPGTEQGEPSPASLRAAARNALHRSEALGCKSVVTTVLGTDTVTVPFKIAANVVCENIDAHDADSLDDVHIVVDDDAQYDYVERIATAVQGA